MPAPPVPRFSPRRAAENEPGAVDSMMPWTPETLEVVLIVRATRALDEDDALSISMIAALFVPLVCAQSGMPLLVPKVLNSPA